MQMTDLLAQLGGLQSMARELGVSEQQAASGAQALLPAILGGFKKQAQAQPAGLQGLGGLLGQLGGGGLLDEVLAPEPTPVSHGNDVLAQIFGSKDVSRAVAQNASSQAGLDPALLQKMLPMLAMLVTGVMSRAGGVTASAAPGGAASGPAGGLGGLAGALGGMLNAGRSGGAGAAPGGGLGGLLGGLLSAGAASGAGGAGRAGAGGGLGGLAGLLDLDGNGNPLDDILRMVGQGRR